MGMVARFGSETLPHIGDDVLEDGRPQGAARHEVILFRVDQPAQRGIERQPAGGRGQVGRVRRGDGGLFQPAVEQALENDPLRQIDVHEGEAAHEGERHLVEIGLVVDVHGADDAPAGVHHIVVGADRFALPVVPPAGREDTHLGLADAVGQVHALTGEHGEQLAEGLVDFRAVHFVDDQPFPLADRLQEGAGAELQRLLLRGHVAADGVEGGPVGRGRGQGGAAGVAQAARVEADVVGQGSLAGAGRAGEQQVLARVQGGDHLLVDAVRQAQPASGGILLDKATQPFPGQRQRRFQRVERLPMLRHGQRRVAAGCGRLAERAAHGGKERRVALGHFAHPFLQGTLDHFLRRIAAGQLLVSLQIKLLQRRAERRPLLFQRPC